ncbi:CAZyme family GT2 [Penicillium roqueforti]|uniref:dolichyl-phosphate beta-glucosyltransferase n=1 Tax=Penicillium roqueforti (strain FM164) TaxID=1365484 RepID=W6QHZ0_PENRF|nr:CAZyme family GT2 [Penicillium roqueforti]CDM36045.1 Dolichyl-phosphate beta-glucosyltransferase [Penicillium roqueforti FM164]KAI2679082.1 CAZyme family GT2 [Penicillium roqueforti]KAI2698778.1 CAZyme family GT2 [Penicillium roqueforti]KAI2700411.1 CAZyme family GT2 [Penicillium roqueforti]
MAAAWGEVCRQCVNTAVEIPVQILLVAALVTLLGLFVLFSLFIFFVAPVPRKPLPEEKKYRTLAKDGSVTDPEPLPCWLESHTKKSTPHTIAPAELFMSVVVPAYNEEDRLTGMLEEAVNYLEQMYGDTASALARASSPVTMETRSMRKRKPNADTTSDAGSASDRGWEIILVSDGSTDRTEEVAFRFARDHQLSLHPKGHAGPWTPQAAEGVHIPSGTIRVVTLTHNRGKGGAVTHGMRHVRGQYVVFADADGASKFGDLGKLVGACRDVEDAKGRAVAVGSRAHMVGSEAVVKRSKLRNFLMHSFHLILWLMTPPKTATVKDTQCGFKLFSRSALPYIVPYMHSEGWIFDVEMLMLAEFARIPVAEVPVGWREVKGSKLNVLRDSIGMAWGLAVLRAAWSLGVYRQR